MWYQVDYESDDIHTSEELSFDRIGHAFDTEKAAEEFVEWRKSNPFNQIQSMKAELEIAERRIELLDRELDIRNEALRMASEHLDVSDSTKPLWVESLIRDARKALWKPEKNLA